MFIYIAIAYYVLMISWIFNTDKLHVNIVEDCCSFVLGAV